MLERLQRKPLLTGVAVASIVLLVVIILLPVVGPNARTRTAPPAQARHAAEQGNLATIRAHASPSSPDVSATWSDTTALVKWNAITGANAYQITLIRLTDMAIMEQKKVAASQLAFDAQGIWPNQPYQVAVQAILSGGTLGKAEFSPAGQASPIARGTYNGFLDTMNLAAGQLDTSLWDVRLGQDNPPNQGGTFLNSQLHGHLEAGDTNGDQTFTSMRARTPFDFSGGRTLTVHGEVDLKADVRNWFATTLSAQAIGGDQIIDSSDRPLAPRAVPQLELFDDQNGLHLYEALPSGAYELGHPYTGGYHTNNVRDEVVWRVSTTHVSVQIDGVTAFDVTLPAPLPFTTGYLALEAEDYPSNGAGITPTTPCDNRMNDCNLWHLDNWGFDAAAGTTQPASAVAYTSQCGPAPAADTTVVTFSDCGRLDNTGGYGFLSEAGQTASTTFTLPSTFNAATVARAGLAFDAKDLSDPTRLSVALNGGPFAPIGYVESRTSSWQSYRIPLDATRLQAGSNTLTFRDAVAGSWNTPQVANLQLETLATSAYSPPQLPPEPAPIGTWTNGGTVTNPAPAPGTPTPAPVPAPISINTAPCTVTINGTQQTGTCSGTFTPTK